MRLISCTFLAILMLMSGPASALDSVGDAGVASGSVSPPERASAGAYQDGMTLEQAVAQVRRQYNGRIVSAETQVSGGREIHVIKVLTSDGKVKTVRVPGRRL
jgi:hypothetical protein